MKLILLIVTVSVVSAEPKCEGKHFKGVFYKMDVLAEDLERPYELSYYKEKHEIFFTTNVGNIKEDKFEIRRLLISDEKRNSTEVEGVKNGFATAVCNDKNIAYFGGSDGIHEFNLKENKMTKIIDKHNIWDIFVKKHLYFIIFPQQHLYKYSERKHKASEDKRIPEHIYQFAIDKDDDIFFTNKTGLFMVKNGTEHRKHITGETVFRCVVVDNIGEAHFCGKNGILVVDKETHTLNEVFSVKNIFGMTFDKEDRIIYSSPTKIVRLTPSVCHIINGIAKYESLPLPEVVAKVEK